MNWRATFVLACAISCKPKTPPVPLEAQPPLDAAVDVAAPLPPAPPEPREFGPFETPFEGARKVYFTVTPIKHDKTRLIANLHGICNPPGYACGYWTNAASGYGFLVCPEGNGRCGGKEGPTTWSEPLAKIDADLEKAILTVDGKYPDELDHDREGAVLTGFSLGATSAYAIARAHPGRWPYLILIEADVQMDAATLRAAGVRAVALLAGEVGSQIAGEKRTVQRLVAQGFPARFWTMKKAGHFYSADIDALMSEALAFVTSVSADAGAAP